MIDNISESGNYIFPNEFATAEEKKTESYGLAYAKALYFRYVTNNTFYEPRLSKYVLNRKYAEGQQSVEKYKNLLSMQNGDTSYLNLDYTPPPIIPKFLDIKVGQMIGQQYKPICTPLNGNAKVEQDEKMAEMYANMFLKNSGISDELESMTGIPVVPKNEYVPKDNDDAKIHFEMNYKNALSMDMEEAIQFVMYNNDWKTIERKVKRDLVVLKIGATRSKIMNNGDIKMEYLDPERLVLPYSQNDNYKDMAHCGYISEITIQDLAMQAPSIGEKELFEIAQSCANKYGNTGWNGGWNWDRKYYPANDLFNNRPYDNFKVKVLDFEFLSIIENKYVKKTKNGKTYLDKKKSSYEMKENREGKELINKRAKVRYAGTWVINTNSVYNYGMDKYMQFPKIDGTYILETNLSFKVIMPNAYEQVNQSLVERMIPFADQICLCHLKMQQIISSIKPVGVAIDISGVENVVKGMGDGQFKPTDLVKMYNQVGSFVYSSQRADGSVINGKPIEQLGNQVGAEIQQLLADYEYNLKMIRDVTGINEVADASTPSSEALVGTSQIALQQTHTATKELMMCFYELAEDLCKDVAMKIQDVLENEGEIKGYYKAIGEEGVKMIKLTNENGRNLGLNELGISIELLPDEYERQEINRYIELGIQTQELRVEDAIYIRNILKSNVKLAAQTLILRKKKYAEEKQIESAMLQEQNAKVQMESSVAAENAKAETAKMLLASEAEKIIIEYKEKSKLSAQEHTQKMEQIRLTNKGNENVAAKKEDGKLLSELTKSAQPKF